MKNIFTYADICDAVKYCFSHTKPKVSILKAYAYREQFAYDIYTKLDDYSYAFTKPRDVLIHEKKDRIIQSPLFSDRVVQVAMLKKGLYHLLTDKCLPCNCSCQVGKGLLYAHTKLLEMLRRHYINHKLEGYVVYIDIHDFYNSINHALLFDSLKSIPDEFLYLIKRLVSTNNPSGYGLSLGSPTSALLANYFLTKIDTYIKTKLHVKYYLRYCDDMVFIVRTKQEAQEVFNYTATVLRLHLFDINKKSHISALHNDVKFLGLKYKLTDTGKIHTHLFKQNIIRIKRRIRRMKRLNIQDTDIKNMLYSWTSHALLTRSKSVITSMWKYAGYIYDKDIHKQLLRLNRLRSYEYRLNARYRIYCFI